VEAPSALAVYVYKVGDVTYFAEIVSAREVGILCKPKIKAAASTIKGLILTGMTFLMDDKAANPPSINGPVFHHILDMPIRYKITRRAG
jgi:hypothetical protein